MIAFVAIYKEDCRYDAYIDITKVDELHQISKGDVLLVGGGVSLTELKDLFDSLAQENQAFRYLSTLAEHIRKIGSLPIRNVSLKILKRRLYSLLDNLCPGEHNCRKLDAKARIC